MNNIQKAQEVYDVIDKIEIPTGEKNVIVPKYAKGENRRKYVFALDQRQQLFLGQILSKEVFPSEDERFSLLPLQMSYDLVHSGTAEGKAFKKINKKYSFYNRELILVEERQIIPDPIVFEEEGALIYDGKRISAAINESDAIDTLIKAGLFKEPEERMWRGPVCVEKNNEERAVSSLWHMDKSRKCFCAMASGSSWYGEHNIVAFFKTDEKAEIDEIKVARREFETLKKDSERLKKLKMQVKKLEKALETL